MNKCAFIFILFFSFSDYVISGVIKINEISVCNISNELDPDDDFSGWIEFYNSSDKDVNLKDYWFSDDLLPSVKYMLNKSCMLPHHDYATIWINDELSDGNGFYLDTESEGGFLSILDKNGTIIDQIAYPNQLTNISYGRTTDGGDTFGYFTRSTRNSSNNGVLTSNTVVVEPEFSLPGGFYSSAIQVSISCQTADAKIYYTLDGSNPGTNKNLYAGEPLLINSSTTLRAQAFAEGFLTGTIASSTYMINERVPDLPVVFLSVDPYYLYDDSIGIYCEGVNGIVAGGMSKPANFNQDWTRPANFEYLDNDIKINQLVGISISGNATRSYDQKSLKIKASGKYGKSLLKNNFFPNKPNMRLKSILLRNGGQNFTDGGIRDAFLQRTSNVLNLDYLDYQPAVVYINTNYWGYMDIRERSNSSYVTSNYGYDEDDVDVIENNWLSEVSEGNTKKYEDLKNYISTSDLSNDQVYDSVLKMVDIDSYLNYMAVELFVANDDWPLNNQKLFCPRENGRWRWIMQDLDMGYKFSNKNMLGDFLNSTSSKFSLRMITYLLKNERFKQRYIDTQCLVAASVFNPVRVNRILDDIQSKIAKEYLFHEVKWGIKHDYHNKLDYSIQFHKDMTVLLRKTAFVNLQTNFKLDTTSLFINSNEPMAQMTFNTLQMPALPYDGMYFKGKVINLSTPQYVGEKQFKHWKICQASNDAVLNSSLEMELTISNPTTIEAVYEEKAVGRRKGLYINEVAASSNTFVDNYFKKEDWIELYNNSTTLVNLNGYYLSNTLENLQLFKFEEYQDQKLTIPGNGFSIVWCSNEVQRGSNHANFKLPKEGGQLFLSADDESGHPTIVDSLTYKSVNEYFSFGRYPDGGDDLYQMVIPTIEKRNLHSSYNTLLLKQAPVLTGNQEVKIDYPKQVHVIYDKGQGVLHVKKYTDNDILIEFFDLSGLLHIKKHLTENMTEINVSHLPDGFYMVQVTGNNYRQMFRFIF